MSAANEKSRFRLEPGSSASLGYDDFATSRSVKRQLVEELRSAWVRGEPVQPESLLCRWPENPRDDPDVASLLFEDYCQRRDHGQNPAVDEYDQRFPSQKNSLARLWDQQAFLRSVAGQSAPSSLTLSLPEVGDEVFGFRLLRELGRGSFARVFCARQASLAGRPVVVKVSAIDGNEPQTLAQLQHTNIVPIYSVHEDTPAALRVVCMPYFGGASLSRVLQDVWSRNELPERGRELVESLARCDSRTDADKKSPAGGDPIRTDKTAVGLEEVAQQEPCPVPPGHCPPPVDLGVEARWHLKPAGDGGPLALLARTSYVRASVWIVARLAEALEHAHERGVLHRDIKPSNVLLSADGQPMLLDFNLAQSVRDTHAQLVATLGGTVAYMAPEHLRALAGRDSALVRQVDQRADVYGLGMVLYEMLTGSRPFDQSGSYSPMPALIEAMAVERARATPSLRERRPDVPWSLESIIRKCLAPDPRHRYQRAAEFAEDLNRFLDDRPLAYAPELSWLERVRKWVRRHPRAASTVLVSTAAGAILAAGTGVWFHTAKRLNEAQGSQARELSRDFRAGAERARCLVNTGSDFAEHVREGADVCRKALALYDVLERNDWQERPLWRRLDREEQQLVAEDVRELLMLLARAQLHLSRTSAAGNAIPGVLAASFSSVACIPKLHSAVSLLAAKGETDARLQAVSQANEAACRVALALLDRAAAIHGISPSRALVMDRAWYLEAIGATEAAAETRQVAASIVEATAQDHYLLAQAYFQKGEYQKAASELQEALRTRPQHYWCRLMLGMCHYELHDIVLAAGEFKACMTLWPEAPWGFFNHARVLQQMDKNREAIADYSAALDRDRSLREAYVNRGLAYLNVNQPQQALADFDRAIANGHQGVVVQVGRGLALERLGRSREADAAFECAWRYDSENLPMLLAYGFAVERRLPGKAMAAFAKVLDKDPRNARALYGYAMLLAGRERDSEAAATCFSLALEADPCLIEARCGRANVLAHRGDWQRARQDADQCVRERPTGQILYAAACIYAVSAEKCPHHMAGALKARAIELLREALDRGYGNDLLAGDEDLGAIREHPKFRALLHRIARSDERS